MGSSNHNQLSNGSSEFSIELLKAGNRTEFASLVDTYSGKIFTLLERMLDNAQDAEDALQETFLKAFRSIRNFEGRSSLLTWINRIAINEALMILRKRRMGTISIDEKEVENDEENEPKEIIDWCCLPEKELLSNEVKQLLDTSIGKLSPLLRAIFLLRDIEGFSIKETAEIMDLSEANVKVSLFRARLHLRDMLSGYFKERLSAR